MMCRTYCKYVFDAAKMATAYEKQEYALCKASNNRFMEQDDGDLPTLPTVSAR